LLTSAADSLLASDTVAATFLHFMQRTACKTSDVRASGREYTPAPTVQSYGSHGTEAGKYRWDRDLGTEQSPFVKVWNKATTLGEISTLLRLKNLVIPTEARDPLF
jgi:hypothetical protein